MKNCIRCNESAGLFSVKTQSNVLCKKCASFLPEGLEIKLLDEQDLLKLIEINKDRSEKFLPTSKYGKLEIDSLHNLFRFTDKPNAIYDIAETKEAGIFAENIRNIGTNTNNVVCNVKAVIRTEKTYIQKEIMRNARCPFERKNGKLECSEPYDLSVFRQVFYQMIENAAVNIFKKLKAIEEAQKLISLHEKKIDWAKGILFIESQTELNKEILKEKRNNLIRIFHPDMNTDFNNSEISAMINEAYKTLNESVKE